MNWTRTAISRPVFILMLMAATLLIGTISYRSMRVEQNPEVNFGTISVSVPYPGADPETIMNLVARPIEEAMSGVNGLREITSTSREGFASINAQFELNTNLDVALNDVRTKVDSVVGRLPEDAERPIISKFDMSGQPIMYMAFSSEKMTSRDLRDLIDDKVRDRFAQISGVASASVQGGDLREIQVQVSKEKLTAYGIGITDVQRAIQAASLDVPGGRVDTGPSEFAVRLKSQFESADDVKNLVFSVRDQGTEGGRPKIVRLRDVAEISDTVAERTEYSRLNGNDTVVLALQKVREGNAIEINKTAHKLVEEVEKQYAAQGVEVEIVYDEAKYIKESIDDLLFALAFGIFLVAAVVYIFLHNFRGTLIVAIAIPLCIFATFIALKIAGFTINNMSMLALSLAVGVLVDDAIVVLENIYRHLRRGEDPRDAAINGRMEIGLAALAITMVDVVVFLPIGFMGGIVGQFFKPLALGFVFAVLSSLFVSFTVTPLLAARWYRKGEDMEHPTGRFAVWFERTFHRFEEFYRRLLQWSLAHRWFVFILGNLALVAVFMFIGGGFAGSIPAAMQMTMPMLMVAGLVGFVVFAANYWPRVIEPRKWMRVSLGLSALAFCLIGPLLPLPMPVFVKPLVGLFIVWVLLGIAAFIANAVRRAAKSRLVLFGLLFGLLFPVAGAVGVAFANYKKEAVFKFQFFPGSDQGQVDIALQLPPGSSLKRTEEVAARVEDVVLKHPDVKYTLTDIGSQSGGWGGGGNTGSNYGQVQVTLNDKRAFMDSIMFWKKHDEKLRDKRADTVAADLTEAIGRVPGAIVRVAAGSGGFGAPIQMTFIGDDRDQLVATAQKIKQGLQSGVIKGVINPEVSSQPGKPEIRAIPDQTRMADAGLTSAEVGLAIRTLYQGNDNAKLRERGREYPIRVMMSRVDRDNPATLEQIPVKFDQGSPVLLGSVIERPQQRPGVDKIDRRQRQEEVRLTADLLPGFAAGSIQAEVNTWIKDNNILGEGVRQRELGQAQAQAEEGAYLMAALGLGVILVYMLLASLYDNLLYPAIIQLAQPQAMVGALLALIITDKELNIVGMIGIIALVGLVGKNAILVVDYANTLRKRGRSRHDALVEAGPTRLRPIMMTTLALVVGTLPVALAIGRGSEFRETIGITIIGGISVSTVLTLLVIPCSYTIFDDLSIWFARKLGRHVPDPEQLEEPEREAEREPVGIA